MSTASLPRPKLALTSGDIVAEQIAKLRRLFPESVCEDKIDFDKLRATLGGHVAAGPKRFGRTRNVWCHAFERRAAERLQES